VLGGRLLPLVLIGTMVITLIAGFSVLWSWNQADRRVIEQESGVSSTLRPSSGSGTTEQADQNVVDNSAPRANNSLKHSYPFATKVHKHRGAGYSFRYPARWELRTQQSVTKLSRPDGHFVISFGLGPIGGLPVAYDELVALLDNTYEDVAVSKVKATHVGGNVGIIAWGAATGKGGVRLQYLAAVIERPDDQRAIGALAATDLSAAGFPPVVREILKSFRPI
jgi:hypothetical protein